MRSLFLAFWSGLISLSSESRNCDSAFKLLVPNQSGGLALSENGLHCLQTFEGPISVVGVVGPYRSGKSFMLNQLVDPSGKKNVFGVGNTVNPHTVGCVAFAHRTDDG